jgi:hypothetical protein
MIATAAALSAAATGAAAAASCKHVKLQVLNSTGSSIRLVDIDYYDASTKRWRSEPTTNRVLDPGERHGDIRNLEGVRDHSVKVRAVYQVKHNGRWRLARNYAETGLATCTEGKRYRVIVE